MQKQLELFGDAPSTRDVAVWEYYVKIPPKIPWYKYLVVDPLTDYLLRVRLLDKPNKLEPITENQKKKMQFPDTKGPLEETLFNTTLTVITADAGEPEYIFEAYFLNGDFKYGGWYGSPGAPNFHCLGEDYHNTHDFLAGIRRQFRMKSDSEFLKFFEGALPETHRKAIRELLEVGATEEVKKFA